VKTVRDGGRCGEIDREWDVLGLARLPELGSEATKLEEVESAEGGRDAGRHHYRRPSAVPTRSVFLLPSSPASRAEARGPAASQVAMAGAEAVRPAGAWARSEVLGTAKALQHWRPDRVDEGVCGGVSGLRRWRLALGK
jgi:hypothetical protein